MRVLSLLLLLMFIICHASVVLVTVSLFSTRTSTVTSHYCKLQWVFRHCTWLVCWMYGALIIIRPVVHFTQGLDTVVVEDNACVSIIMLVYTSVLVVCAGEQPRQPLFFIREQVQTYVKYPSFCRLYFHIDFYSTEYVVFWYEFTEIGSY